MKPLFLFALSLGIYFATAMAADSSFRCDQLKLDRHFFAEQVTRPEITWTEEKVYLQPPGQKITYQPEILDRILAYQNERMMGCWPEKPRGVSPLYQHPRVRGAKTLRMTIAIGYYDQTGEISVMDPYFYNVLIAKLAEPCQTQWNANCGFALRGYSANKALLSKKIGNGRTFEIQLLHPAITHDDFANRQNPQQKMLSDEIERAFHQSFKDSQFVFYMGHSRYGGGPDFSPAKLASNGNPKYKWYAATKIKLNEMTEALKEIPPDQRPLVFGFLGCSSKQHFQNRLRALLPDAGLLLSKEEIFRIEFMEGALTFINGIQWGKSAEEMNMDLDAVNIAHRQNGNRDATLLYFDFPVLSSRADQ